MSKEERKLELKEKTDRRLEMVEFKQNIWKSYRNEEGGLVEVNKENIKPKQKKKKQKEDSLGVNRKFSSLQEYYQEEKRKKEDEKKQRQEKAKKLKESWELMKLCVEYIEENGEHWKNIASEEKKKREELWRVDEKVRLENDKRKSNQQKEQTSKKENILKSKALASFWKNWTENVNLDESSSQLEDNIESSSLPEAKEDRENETKGGGKNYEEGFAHPGKTCCFWKI